MNCYLFTEIIYYCKCRPRVLFSIIIHKNVESIRNILQGTTPSTTEPLTRLKKPPQKRSEFEILEVVVSGGFAKVPTFTPV